ncbi:hypothetical protein Lser_V15G04328 [Lactuca serriola]
MNDSLLSSISSFHTKKIIVADLTKFFHNGSIPETMYQSVSQESKLISDYKFHPPKHPRQLTPEMQEALEEVEKPTKRGKKSITKKEDITDYSSKPVKSKKRKADKGDSSTSKKVKKMAQKKHTPSPSPSELKDEQFAGEDEEEQHEGSPWGNTPPRTPTPVDIVDDSVPTPPLSPPKTTVRVTIAPPPPSSSPLVSTIAPPPPASSTPITTAPLPPPIFSNATFTTTPIITSTIDSSVNVNTSDVGEKTEEPPNVTTEPLSPTPSSDSNPVLGGADFEFDSTYYSPYRIPSEEDESAPVTKQQIDSVHEKLDSLLASTTKIHRQITAAMDDSTSLCKRDTSDVKDLIHDYKVFLDTFKGHADSNAAKISESIDSLSQSLQAEQTKFETVHSNISADNKTFLSSIDSRFEKLTADFHMERQLKDDLAQQTAINAVQHATLAKAEQDISLLKTERAVFCSCAGDVLSQLHNVLQAHDPILMLTIRNHLTSKLLPSLELLREMKGVLERIVPPQQGGEEKPQPISIKPKVKTKPKDNVASGSGIKDKKKHDDDDKDQETISVILNRKKRDEEIDETLRTAKEAEEKEKKKKEEDDTLSCKKMLFPSWIRETLTREAIEFPSTYWLEPVTSFDCENTRDSEVLKFNRALLRC